MILIAELQLKLAIDKTVLDDEVIKQPVLFYTISEALTDAFALRDGAKEELASVDAEMDSVWRSKLAKIHDKVTEKMVQNSVQCSSAHEKAFDEYLKAKTYADKLLALKEAFQQRSYMLRDLVSLYSANYYETSSIRPNQATAHYNANRQHMSDARAARSK